MANVWTLTKLLVFLRYKKFKADLQYPANFVSEMIGTAFIGVGDILMLWIPSLAFKTIGGWNFWQLGFMFALWKLAHGLHAFMFGAFLGHDDLIRDGEYDRLLVRPVHPLFQIVASDSWPADALSEWIPSFTMLLVTAPHVQVPWTALTIAWVILIVISGAVIEWAVSLFISVFGFFFTRTNNLRGIASTFLFRVAHFPAHIYGRVFAFVLTFVFPYAFMAYYPTHYFFKLDVQLYSTAFPYITPLVALILLAIAMLFWRIGLGHYQSTGS